MPELFAVSVIVIIFIGVAKSGFIGGSITIAMPIMSLYMQPAVAAAVILPLLVTMDAANVWHYRKNYSKKIVGKLLPGAVIGIIIGYTLFEKLSPDIFRLIIGIVAITFVIMWLIKNTNNRPIPKIVGTFLAAIGGFTSFVAHSGAPPVDAYLLRQNLTKTVMVATSVYLFTIINALKVGAYAHLGLLNYDNMLMSIMLMPCVPIGVMLGHYLHNKISQEWFEKITYIILIIVGTKLISDGITHLAVG